MSNAERPAEPPKSGTNVLTRDPVRIVWVVYGFVQAIVIVLVAVDVIGHVVSYVATGIALAFYVAVSELFVRHETVPLEPLRDLVRAEQARADAERGKHDMTETQGWFIVIELAVLALAALRGLIGR